MSAPPTVSLGGVKPGPPSTWRGTIMNVPRAAVEPLRNPRRVREVLGLVIGQVLRRMNGKGYSVHSLNLPLSPALSPLPRGERDETRFRRWWCQVAPSLRDG